VKAPFPFVEQRHGMIGPKPGDIVGTGVIAPAGSYSEIRRPIDDP
jgi:hypothetical protein